MMTEAAGGFSVSTRLFTCAILALHSLHAEHAYRMGADCMGQPERRRSFLSLALLVLISALVASPARAFDPSHDYEIAPGFSDYPIRGAANAAGAVIWTHPYGHMDEQLPPVVMGLAAHGWDVFKLMRNPDKEKQWFAVLPNLAGEMADQVKNAAQLGYKNVILGGQGEGAVLALEAAAKTPTLGVIALSPNAGQSAYFTAAQSVQRVTADLGALATRRVLLVMPNDNEVLPGANQAAAARQALNGRGISYLIIDSQVHGYYGGYSGEMLPYAGCAALFFSPQATLQPGEFHCYHDEATALLQSFGANESTANRIWMGYVDGAGQPLFIAEHRSNAGETSDFGIGGNLRNGKPVQFAQAYPASWQGNVFVIASSAMNVVTLQPTQTQPFWSYRYRHGTEDWTATLALIVAR